MSSRNLAIASVPYDPSMERMHIFAYPRAHTLPVYAAAQPPQAFVMMSTRRILTPCIQCAFLTVAWLLQASSYQVCAMAVPSTTEAGFASCSASSLGSVSGSVRISREANWSGSTLTATSRSTIHTRISEDRIFGQMQEMFLYMDLTGGMNDGCRSGHSFGSPAHTTAVVSHAHEQGPSLRPDAGDVFVHGPDGWYEQGLQIRALIGFACKHTSSAEHHQYKKVLLCLHRGQMQDIILYMNLTSNFSAGFRSAHSFGSPAHPRMESYPA